MELIRISHVTHTNAYHKYLVLFSSYDVLRFVEMYCTSDFRQVHIVASRVDVECLDTPSGKCLPYLERTVATRTGKILSACVMQSYFSVMIIKKSIVCVLV